jgi:LCP family protein required for cell wall assembly
VLDDFHPSDDGTTRSSRRRRRRRVVAVTLSLLLLLGVGTAAGYLLFLNQTVSGNVKRASLLPTPGVSGVPDTPAPTKQPGATETQNILLVGSDARPGEGGGRSDVIVLAHVSGDGDSVHLIHFPRDLYVQIPGRGGDKINAAYAYGGAPLLVSTVQDLVGVPIDHVAMIDFDGFKNMTDAVGGVKVYVHEASSSGQYSFAEGFQHMDGDEALAFVRQRKQLSEGDISRGKRQQAFIKALMLKTLSRDVLTNPVRLAQFTDAATSNLTVDEAFSTSEMRKQAFSMRNLRGSDIAFVTAPFTGFGTAPNGGSIEILDKAGFARLSEALQRDEMDRYEDVTRTP